MARERQEAVGPELELRPQPGPWARVCGLLQERPWRRALRRAELGERQVLLLREAERRRALWLDAPRRRGAWR